MCRNSVVRTETSYGLDGLGIESRWGQDILHRPDQPRAHPATDTMGTGLFPRVKPARNGVMVVINIL